MKSHWHEGGVYRCQWVRLFRQRGQRREEGPSESPEYYSIETGPRKDTLGKTIEKEISLTLKEMWACGVTEARRISLTSQRWPTVDTQ